jgi:hypothetical protein
VTDFRFYAFFLVLFFLTKHLEHVPFTENFEQICFLCVALDALFFKKRSKRADFTAQKKVLLFIFTKIVWFGH